MKKRILRVTAVAAVVLGVGLLLSWGYFEALKRAWIQYNEYDIRTEGNLRVGDLAPDLELEVVGGEEPLRISDLYKEKPLVLVFGSYT